MDTSAFRSSCVWCSEPEDLQSDLLYHFCVGDETKYSDVGYIARAEESLSSCFSCVVAFHQSLLMHMKSKRFAGKRKEIYARTVARICKSMRTFLEQNADLDSTGCYDHTVLVPLFESLKYPRFLLDSGLNALFVESMQRLISEGEGAGLLQEKLPGLYLLLVHPNNQVRGWAISTVKELGSLNWDEYDLIEEILEWVLNVIHFNLFVMLPTTAGPAAWQSGETVLLPSFTFVHGSPKEFWLGVCMLLKALDPKCVHDRLLTSTSSHKHLVDAVIHALHPRANDEYTVAGEDSQSTHGGGDDTEATKTVFWPALQILVTLLDRLKFRFWQFTLKRPEDIFSVIVTNQFFQLELRAQVDSSQEVSTSVVVGGEMILDPTDDELFSNSQVVYNWSSSDNPEAANEDSSVKVRSAFSWVCPFVSSLLEFGKVAEKSAILSLGLAGSILGKKLTIDDGNHLWMSLPTLNKPLTLAILKECQTYDQCLLFLSQLVHLLYTQERYSLMVNTKESWLSLMCTAMALFCSVTKDRRAPRRSFVYSTGSATTTVVMPASLMSVSKVTLSILNSSAGRKVPGAVAIVSLINRHSNNTPLQLSHRRTKTNWAMSARLNEDGISSVLLQVIETCSSSQDLQGPYLSFDRGKAIPPTSSLLVSVKQEGCLLSSTTRTPSIPIKIEPFDSTIPLKPVSQIKQEKGSCFRESFDSTITIKQEKENCSCTFKKPSKQIEPCVDFGLDLDSEESDDNDCILVSPESSSDELPSFSEQLQLLSSRKRVRREKHCPLKKVKHTEPVKRCPLKKVKRTKPIIISSDSEVEHSLPVSVGVHAYKVSGVPCLKVEAQPSADPPVLVQKADSTTIPSTGPEGMGHVSDNSDSIDTVGTSRLDESELSEQSVFPDSQVDTSFIFEDFSSQVQRDNDSSDIEGCDNAVALAARQETFFPHDCYTPPSSNKNSLGDLSPARIREPSPVPIYQKEFKVPSLTVQGQDLSSQSSVRIRPCKLIVSKVPVSMYTKHQRQCNTFMHCNKWFDEPTASLIVSIPLDFFCKHKSQVEKEQEGVGERSTITTWHKAEGTTERICLSDPDMFSGDPRIAKEVVSRWSSHSNKDSCHSNKNLCPLDERNVFTKSQVLVETEVLTTPEPVSKQSSEELFNSEDLFTSSQVYVDHEVLLMDNGSRTSMPGVVVEPAGLVVTVPLVDSQGDSNSVNPAPVSVTKALVPDLVDKVDSAVAQPLVDMQQAHLVPSARRLIPSSLPLASLATSRSKKTTISTSTSLNVIPLSKSCGSLPKPQVQNRPFTPQPILCQKKETFYLKFLSWDPTWFLVGNYQPHWLLSEAPQRIPDIFDSYKHYFQVFEPLILLELWGTILEQMKLGKSVTPVLLSEVVSQCTSEMPFHQMKCKTSISPQQLKECVYPNEGFLVIVDWNVADMSWVTTESEMKFAVVEHAVVHNSDGSHVELFLDLCLMGSDADLFSSTKQKVKIYSLASLALVLCQWEALCKLHQNRLSRDLLSPRGGEYFGLKAGSNQQSLRVSQEEEHLLHGMKYNYAQYEAIQAAVDMVCMEYIHPRVLLLQGPPGTGKTHTITGLICSVFKALSSQKKCSLPALPGQRRPGSRVTGRPEHPHILLCAPSNAAVDELVKRLLREGLVFGSGQWKEKNGKGTNASPIGLKVVRVGHLSRIHKDVQCISLDKLIENAKKHTDGDLMTAKRVDDLRNQIVNLEHQIQILEREELLARLSVLPDAEKTQCLDISAKLREKKEEKCALEETYRKVQVGVRNNHLLNENYKRNLLMNADVICCTLSRSGMIRKYFSMMPLHFSCVIVDEASQCSELEVLVPLCFGTTKLILVGDPAQLAAVIKSEHAKTRGLGQSMLERLFSHFNRMCKEDNPVRMLKIQYRMLDEICHFPSQHFYRGSLITDRSLTNKGAKSRLRPFVMFDVTLGQEISEFSSLKNIEECQLLLEVVTILLDNSILPSKVGVITPYRLQENLIKKKLFERFDRAVEVGTVDGFQGREKDVIILSTVRANSSFGSIGFLSDRKRMNVALTRAKIALYVIGHCKSLEVSQDWADFIQYARGCEAIQVCTDNNYRAFAERIIKQPCKIPTCMDLAAPISESGQSTHSRLLLDPRKRKVSDSRPDRRSRDGHKRDQCSQDHPHQRHRENSRPSFCRELDTHRMKPPYHSEKVKSDKWNRTRMDNPDFRSVSTTTQQNTSTLTTAASRPRTASNGDEVVTPTTPLEHEVVLPWPDSQSSSDRHTIHDYHALNYTACFPPPPANILPRYTGSTWRPHGGERKRVAHSRKK